MAVVACGRPCLNGLTSARFWLTQPQSPLVAFFRDAGCGWRPWLGALISTRRHGTMKRWWNAALRIWVVPRVIYRLGGQQRRVGREDEQSLTRRRRPTHAALPGAALLRSRACLARARGIIAGREVGRCGELCLLLEVGDPLAQRRQGGLQRLRAEHHAQWRGSMSTLSMMRAAIRAGSPGASRVPCGVSPRLLNCSNLRTL